MTRLLDSRRSHFSEWGKNINKLSCYIPDGGGTGSVSWIIHWGGDMKPKPWKLRKNSSSSEVKGEQFKQRQKVWRECLIPQTAQLRKDNKCSQKYSPVKDYEFLWNAKL